MMATIRLCEHFVPFKLRADETAWLSISPTHPWNGWVMIENKRGSVFGAFESGVTWTYLEHLTRNPECLSKSGLSLREVLELLEEVEREWIKVV